MKPMISSRESMPPDRLKPDGNENKGEELNGKTQVQVSHLRADATALLADSQRRPVAAR
jgi:hypothetical protein